MHYLSQFAVSVCALQQLLPLLSGVQHNLESLPGWLHNIFNQEAAWNNNCPNPAEFTRYTLKFVLKREDATGQPQDLLNTL